MDFGDNTTKIILAIIAAVFVSGGTWVVYRKNKTKKYKNTQSNVTMTGDGNKVTAGDDNSTSTGKP